MRADIQNTLKRISALTGLRFTRTADPSTAQLRFGWKGGQTGSGVGTSWAVGQAVIAQVNLGSKDWHNANTWRGFSPNVRRGVPGHNWKLATFVLQALGLDYTSQPRNLMNEIVSSSTITWQPRNARFGTGDRAGLAYLYQPQTCGRAR